MATEMKGGQLVVKSTDDLMALATGFHTAGIAPKGLESPNKIFAALVLGAELGMTPGQSLRWVAVINGRPSVYGDGILSVARADPNFKGIRSWFELDGAMLDGPLIEKGKLGDFPDSYTACCEVSMKEGPPQVERFSVGMAKLANLWGKAGPWSSYPHRMLAARARSYALRDSCPAALGGVLTPEEATEITEREAEYEIVEKPAGEPVGSLAEFAQQMPEVTPKAAEPELGEIVEAFEAGPEVEQDVDPFSTLAFGRIPVGEVTPGSGWREQDPTSGEVSADLLDDLDNFGSFEAIATSADPRVLKRMRLQLLKDWDVGESVGALPTLDTQRIAVCVEAALARIESEEGATK